MTVSRSLCQWFWYKEITLGPAYYEHEHIMSKYFFRKKYFWSMISQVYNTKGGAKLIFGQFFLKTTLKWKKLDSGCASHRMAPQSGNFERTHLCFTYWLFSGRWNLCLGWLTWVQTSYLSPGCSARISSTAFRLRYRMNPLPCEMISAWVKHPCTIAPPYLI